MTPGELFDLARALANRARLQPTWQRHRDALGPISAGEILAGLIHTREQLARPGSWHGGPDSAGRVAGAVDASGRALTDEEFHALRLKRISDGLVRKGVNPNGLPGDSGDLPSRSSGDRGGARLRLVTAERIAAIEQAVSERLADEIRRGGSGKPLPPPIILDESYRDLTPDMQLLVDWNNAPWRKHDDVLQLLDAAIARERDRVVAQARRRLAAGRRRPARA